MGRKIRLLEKWTQDFVPYVRPMHFHGPIRGEIHFWFFGPESACITKVHLTPRFESQPSLSPESARALHKARNPASIFTRASFVIEALVSQIGSKWPVESSKYHVACSKYKVSEIKQEDV